MSDNILGQVCSLLAAITWAIALVMFKRCGERIPPLAMNLFKNVVGLVFFALVLLLMEDTNHLRNIPIEDTFLLIISGVLGIALADTLLFECLNRIGVGLYVVIDCCYSPIVAMVSWFMISEKLGTAYYVGGSLILLGILVSSGHPLPVNRTRGQILVGILLGVLSFFFMAVGIVMAKPVFDSDQFPLFWGTTIRMLSGTAALVAITLASPLRKDVWRIFRPSAMWKLSIPASFFGAFLSMVLWVAGFKYTDASVAAILNQTSIIFAIILARFFLEERLTKRKLTSITLAITGVLVITFRTQN